MQCNNSVLSNATLAALVCSASTDTSPCVAICPNADISGVGVRAAFYLQSFFNTLLVIFSKRDSVPSTWAATLLTGALVIAAMIQKSTGNITLHHAILTMNFATLSCISSLAVAPTLSIWRLTPHEYYAKRLARDLLDDEEDHRSRLVGTAVEAMTGHDRRRIERAQDKQRLFLALALLTQVVLQWAWGVVLFVSPSYSQTNCSGQTKLMFFLAPFTASEINHNLMVVWVLWLLFSLGITLGMTIVLALTSPTRARAVTTRSTPASGGTRSSSVSRGSQSPGPPVYEQLYLSAVATWRSKSGKLIFWYNILCIVLWAVYIVSSELQISMNYIFAGENAITSFGQITALLLSLAPMWSLTVALYKWPEMQRKLARRRRRAEQQQQSALQSQHSTHSPLSSTANRSFAAHDPDARDKNAPKDGDLSLEHSTTVVVVAASPARDVAVPGSEAGAGADDPPVSRGPPYRSSLRLPSMLRPRGPRSQPVGHVRFPTLDGVHIARTTTEEWNELVRFSGSE